jgi:D-glycero-D-manno-heptose 1,7-bisphosphate phosphatase
MKTGVFLDRDGVINKSLLVNGLPMPPSNLGGVEIMDGVVEAIRILKENNYVPVVVTNQPDVARGLTTENCVNDINKFIGTVTGIDYFYTCFHDDEDLCACRKPAPGLILRAATDLNLNICKSFMVGDRWRDISASQAAGCKAFFIDHSYPETQPKMPFTRVTSLLEATKLMTGKLP